MSETFQPSSLEQYKSFNYQDDPQGPAADLEGLPASARGTDKVELPQLAVFSAGDGPGAGPADKPAGGADKPAGGAENPQMNPACPGGQAGIGGFQGFAGPRVIDNKDIWRGRLSTPNAVLTMQLIGPLGGDYLQVLDANAPLRLNSIPAFMNCGSDAERQKVMAGIKASLKANPAALPRDSAEDAISDPTEAHRRQALRFMLTVDAKIRLDRIMRNKAGKQLDAADEKDIKDIVTNLLREENEILKPFEDFLDGYNNSPLKVKAEGDTRYGLPAEACSIRELANREKTKNIVLFMEKATDPAATAIKPEQVAEVLENLTRLAREQPPSTAATQLLERFAGAGINVPQTIADLRSGNEASAKAAMAALGKHLPEAKYAGFSPARICQSIPKELLTGIVRDEEKRALTACKAIAEPLIAFCAGKDGRPLPAAERQQLIEQTQQAAAKQGIGTDVCAWMQFKDVQLRLLEAQTPEAAVKALQLAKHLVDVDNNRSAAGFLANLPDAAVKIQQKLGLKEDPLVILGRPGDPDAARVLVELKALIGDLKPEVGEKGARAILADLTDSEGPAQLEQRISRLEKFADSSPFAKDQLDMLKTESLLQRMKLDAGDPQKITQHVESLLKLGSSGNAYARAAAIEMLVDEKHTVKLNENENEVGRIHLVKSYKTKLEDCLKVDAPESAALVKTLRQQIAQNVLSQDLQTLGERQIAILAAISGRSARDLSRTFNDAQIGPQIAEKLLKTANEGDPSKLENLASGVFRSLHISNDAHPHRLANVYSRVVERGGVPVEKLRDQYALMVDMAFTSRNKEAVRIMAALAFRPEIQDCQRSLDKKKVGSPFAELKLLHTKFDSQPDRDRGFKEHIEDSVKEFCERTVFKQEDAYPAFMLQMMAALRRGSERPPAAISENLVANHKSIGDLYAHMKLKDQAEYHYAQAAEITRAKRSLKPDPKEKAAGGDPVKTLVEEILAVAGKLSVEADHSKFKVQVADGFLLQCLEKCPGLRLPLGIREMSTNFKGFELANDEFRFFGKVDLPIRANDSKMPFLGVDKVVQVGLDNTSGKLTVDAKLDKLSITDIKGLTLTLNKGAAAAIEAKMDNVPADQKWAVSLLVASLKGGMEQKLQATSIEIDMQPQKNGDALVSLKMKVKMGPIEQEIAEQIALPKEQADQLRGFFQELRKPADERNPAAYLQKFVSLGLDERFNDFISKFDSFKKTADGGFECTRKEPAEFDLGNLKLLVGTKLAAKPLRGDDCSIITGIEGLSAKIPLPDSLAERLHLKESVNIKELRIGDLKNGKRKISIETDSVYKRIDIELDEQFKLVKDSDGNIDINVLMSKDNKELAVRCRCNPESLQNGKILDGTWSFELKGSPDLKEELLGGFLKELSPLSRNIENITNRPTATRLTLSQETKFSVKGVELKFDREVALERPRGVRADGGFSAGVKGVEVTRFGDARLYRFIYGGKSLLKPESIEWKPGGDGENARLEVTPSKKSAITEAKFEMDKNTFKPVAGSITIDNPIEAATSPGSETWTSITAKLKADGNGDLEIDNWAELIANLTVKTILVNVSRPVRLVVTGVKWVVSLFD